MSRIINLTPTTTLGTEDQAIIRQGTIDKRISLSLGETLSWAKREGYIHLGEHTSSVTFSTTESFTTYQGRTYFVKDGVSLPYTSAVADASTDSNLQLGVSRNLSKLTATDVGAYSKTESGNEFLSKTTDDSFSVNLTAMARDKSIKGNYDSYKTAQIWAVGRPNSYSDPTGGDFGYLYGLGYKHTNNTTGGEMATGHQVVWCDQGIPRAAMGQEGLWGLKVYDGDGADRKQVYSPNNLPPSMGVGQTYKIKTADYLAGVTYSNTSDRTIFISAWSTGANARLVLQVDGLTVAVGAITVSGTEQITVGAPVPANSTFKIIVTYGTLAVVELS